MVVNPTWLLAPAPALNEGAIGANGTMPSIPAGNNRIVPVDILCYNGGTTANTPTSVTCNGRTATFLCGDNPATVNTKLSASTYYFKEADVSFISGQPIVTSGQSGTVKSIAVGVIQDAAQTTPANVNSGWATSGSFILALTRVANSFTVAFGSTSSSGTNLNLGNPSRAASVAFTNRQTSYGYQSDSAGTSNFTSNVSNTTSVRVFNVAPFPAGSIDSVNGGAYNAVLAGSTGNTVTVSSGFVPTSGMLGGKAISALTNTSGNNYSFTAAGFVDGQTFYEPDINQQLILTDGSASPVASVPAQSPAGMTSILAAAPVLDENTYIGYWMNLLGYTPVDNDRFISITAHCSVGADGGVLAPSAVTTQIWLWRRSNTTLYKFDVTINQSGAIVSVFLSGKILVGKILSGSILKGKLL